MDKREHRISVSNEWRRNNPERARQWRLDNYEKYKEANRIYQHEYYLKVTLPKRRAARRKRNDNHT